MNDPRLIIENLLIDLAENKCNVSDNIRSALDFLEAPGDLTYLRVSKLFNNMEECDKQPIDALGNKMDNKPLSLLRSAIHMGNEIIGTSKVSAKAKPIKKIEEYLIVISKPEWDALWKYIDTLRVRTRLAETHASLITI